MKVDYNYDRASLNITAEREDIKTLSDIKKNSGFEKAAEEKFITTILNKFGFVLVTDLPRELFGNVGPVIQDVVSKDGFIFEGWAYCNFMDKLINLQTVTFTRI